MIVMIVGYNHGIDGRQILERQAGRRQALGTSPGHWACATAPLGIRQNINAVNLYQESCVTDPSNAWVDASGPQRAPVVGNPRRVKTSRGEKARREAAENETPAGPSRRPVKIGVGVAKSAGNMVRRASG